MDDRYASFRGQDGNEAEEFIQAVRKAAFDANKDRDDEWMARFASTCMSGKALRWYESLDDDVQESWKGLKKAILVSYPPAHEDSIIPSPSAAPAAPAAAPPPAAPEPPSFPEVDIAPPASLPPEIAPAPLGSSTSEPSTMPFDGARGSIEIRYAETNRLMGHLSGSLRGNGAAQVIRGGRNYGEEAQAYVKNEPPSIYYSVNVASGFAGYHQLIGLTWVHQRNARAPAGYRYAAAGFMQGSDELKSSLNSHAYKGGSEVAIWDIASDGNMTAMSGGKPLAFYVYDETNQINLFPHFNSYVASRGVAHQWDRVNLIFRKDRYA